MWNPLMMLGMGGKMLFGDNGLRQAPAVAPPPPTPKPIPEGSVAARAAAIPNMPVVEGMSPGALASLFGTLREPSTPNLPPAPGVVAPESGRAVNPAFSQGIMQALMELNGPSKPQPTLAQLLAGLR